MSAVQLDRQNLPSYIKFYKQFDESNVECKSGCDNNITNVTDRCKGNKCNVTIDRIKKALGYIYHECGKDKTPSKEEAYHFFYYWLGDKLSKSEEGRANFLAEIGLICDAINDSCTSGQKCGIPRDNPEPSTFDSQKKIFDYYYDYSRIKENLKNGEPNCHDSWSSYRAEVSLACDVVKEYCAGKGKDDEKAYCEEFKTKYLPYCTMAKLSELTCELTSTQQRIVSAATLAVSSKANEAVSKATTTASLTSSMVAVGLQTILLLLYRYTPLSSWFGNHPNGGGRGTRKKGSNRRQQFDELTTDTSTIGYTESSETNSILDPTVRSASPYTGPSTRPSTRGAGSNTPSLQNIGYHST